MLSIALNQKLAGRAAFTLALGKDIYFRMAYALARSALRHGLERGIEFVIVADRPISERPTDLAAIRWIEVPPGAYGGGFSPKLHLDKLAPAERSLFIDADCLCVGPLAPAFEAFSGRTVSVLGKRVSEGEWFGDIRAIRERFGLTGYPRFNGGVYYIEPGEIANSVYRAAREVEAKYDEIGFIRLRGAPNDEVCMALALEQHGLSPIRDDGTIMNTLLETSGGFEIDVLGGHAVLYNTPGAIGVDPFFDLSEMRPALVHFVGRDVSDHPYGTEVMALELAHRCGWPVGATRVLVTIVSAWPWLLTKCVKDALRPCYRRLFGMRAVPPTAR
jgi:hypothetical protein